MENGAYNMAATSEKQQNTPIGAAADGKWPSLDNSFFWPCEVSPTARYYKQSNFFFIALAT